MSKKLIASTVFVALMFVAIYGNITTEVRADQEPTDFVKKFSEKFNLSEDEVSSFMDEIRADRFAQMQEKFEDHLRKAVEAGKLTEEQMQEILEMRSDHWAQMDSFRSLSPDERAEMMKEHHNLMKIWMDENGVDFQAVFMH